MVSNIIFGSLFSSKNEMFQPKKARKKERKKEKHIRWASEVVSMVNYVKGTYGPGREMFCFVCVISDLVQPRSSMSFYRLRYPLTFHAIPLYLLMSCADIFFISSLVPFFLSFVSFFPFPYSWSVALLVLFSSWNRHESYRFELLGEFGINALW